MKQLFLTSALALCMICPAFANIDKDASTATCDNATIGTTTGPANLQADWTANTINLDWYSDGEKLTVDSSSTTCTYDGAIILPETPTAPTGYTFGGWKKTCTIILLPPESPISDKDGCIGRLTMPAFGNHTTEEINNFLDALSGPLTLVERIDCKKAKKIRVAIPKGCVSSIITDF